MSALPETLDKQIKILFIEDDAIVRRVVSIGLEKTGCQVVTCTDGRDAMNLLNSETFDIILVDMMMPHMDGLQFLSWLRNTAKIQIPVIVQSSLKKEEVEEQIKECGAQDFITKPARLPDLIAKIKFWSHPENL